MKNPKDKSSKQRIQNKISFLDNQLSSLDRYLPETYEYLMQELDFQKKSLAELEVQEHYQQLETNELSEQPIS